MKTTVVISRQTEYRDLHGIKVRQDLKSKFFNANDLLDIYNSVNPQLKEIKEYLRLKSTSEFASSILKDMFQNRENSTYLTPEANVSQSTELDTIEQESHLIQTKRGKNGGTWVHPYIFMDFAMWLSPEFKLTCIKWIYDNLIQTRDECGDGFNEVKKALFDIKPNSPHYVYSNEANMLNKIIFGSASVGQRNTATEDQLDKLKTLQKADVKLIKDGLDYYERYEKLKELYQYL